MPSPYTTLFRSIPSGDGFFVLPATDTYLIEVTSTATNVTGAYSVTLADPSTAYGVTGTVQRGGVALSGVTVTFTQVAGTGALPGAVMTGASGLFSQTGFTAATVYRATPSLSGYVFTPPSLDFDAPANLNFTATALGCSGFTATPITVGQTLNGTLANTDCQAPELGNPSGYFANRSSFSGVAGQAVAITGTSTAFTPYLFLLHGSDASQVTSTSGSQSFARIPSGDGFFVRSEAHTS